ncbi:hypothetical protein T02_6948, partial [Trichinella nativa]
MKAKLSTKTAGTLRYEVSGMMNNDLERKLNKF